jgi:polysaccharide pyruvyl transferase WcaK-like protein
MMNCDGVLVGGGEQLSESRFPNPIWGHLATNVQLGFFSRLLKKKYGLLGVGVDQRISKLGWKTLALALRGASFIGVRDSASKERVQAIIGNMQAVSLGADPAFLMKPIDLIRERSCLLERFGIPPNAKVVLFVLSVDKFHSLKYLDEINKTVKQLVKRKIWIIYALSDLQESFDMRLYRDRLLYEGENTVWFPPGEGGIEGLRKVIAATDCVVASRMHPLIFALVQSTPIVCLARSVKMHALMDMIGESDYLKVTNLNSSELTEAIARRLEAGERWFEGEIAHRVLLLRKRARNQFEELVKRWISLN